MPFEIASRSSFPAQSNTPVNDMDADQRSHTRVRLAWRWKKSGWTGAGPWIQDPGIVEGWLDSLSHRYGEQIFHWIESEGDDADGEGRPGPTPIPT